MALQRLLVGTYNQVPFGTGEGIYSVYFNIDTGELLLDDVYKDCENPSWLVTKGKDLYVACELLEKGSLSRYKFKEERTLQRLETRDFSGSLSCHLTLWPENTWMTVSNYGSGSFTLIPIGENGTLGKVEKTIQFSGSGPNAKRQEGPHTHSSYVSPDGRWLVVAELGIDRVMIYRIDPLEGTLIPGGSMPYWQAPAGSGPRHFAFNKEGNTLYIT
ncbi:MAG: lactonase family protein, partial [Clostridiales bacterium]|nr:lactonase family protein [Clostridiales bacterium]